MKKKILWLLALLLGACQQHASLDSSANEVIENVTCPQSESRLFDVVYKSLTESQQIPTQNEIRGAFERALKSNSKIHLNEEQLLNLVSEFYSIILPSSDSDPRQSLKRVTALEIGDQTTPEAKDIQDRLSAFQKKWDQYKSLQSSSCAEVPPAIAPPQPEQLNAAQLLVRGARKVLVTAYQSCQAGDLSPMTSSTPDVEGISRVGTHPDGVGAKRAITDLPAVQRTDYYLQTKDQSSSCQNVKANPLIYDYGGKPKTTADDNSSLDLFNNAGSGTSARGIDCSAFVFSAIAASGSKLDPGKKMKAILVNGVSSTMFMNPAKNGLGCFEKTKMGVSGTLRAGDIVAISGHVLMIDSVGADPLGLSRVQTSAQCANLTFQNFDFVIAQSSPSKNGIGINRYHGSDYLAETPSMLKGFEAYARQACVARFQKKDVLMSADGFQIVRHTRSETCRAPEISLAGEACSRSCRNLD